VHPDVAGLLCSLGNSSVAPVAKFAVAFPLLYHWLGGVRHTVWDKVNKALAARASLACKLAPDRVRRASMRGALRVIGLGFLATTGQLRVYVCSPPPTTTHPRPPPSCPSR
jgi:hypothetical protein